MKNLLLLTFFSISQLFYSTRGLTQAPTLGSASSFVLFTSAGAFNVNGSGTNVTGDVGTNVGAFNGFPPGILSGNIYVADVTSTQVASDVCNAYNDLKARPCGTNIAIALGGQTLIPGEYCTGTGAAATLDGELILNGSGVYVIKIDGAFATTDFSTVTLQNGATWDNVFFQVNGEVDLGANSTFRGTIYANGAINLLDGAFLMGRAFACAGAITLNNNTVTTTLILLPIKLLAFSAAKQGETSIIKWSTASEQNSKEFIVERSNTSNVNSWVKIGTMAAAGNSSTTRNYSIIDNKVIKGANYYRLRSTVTDGKFTISNVALVSFSETGSISIFPNPVKNSVTVRGASQGSTIMLTDMAGKTLKRQLASGNGIDHVETNNLIPGTYLLKVVPLNGKATNIKLNKQ